MIGKIKKIVRQFEELHKTQIEKSTEIEWAFIYHDTIKGREWLESLAISPGRWAGNYSFFYVLVRILIDYKPLHILECGLGESSKIISSFLKNELYNSTHLIVEHDNDWVKAFATRFTLAPNSQILNLPLEEKSLHIKGYEDIEKKILTPFDFYVIDGPFGTEKFSRNDICLLATKFSNNSEFIILIDDYNRFGEKDTANELIEILKSKGISVFIGTYGGTKQQIVIATQKYKYVTSL